MSSECLVSCQCRRCNEWIECWIPVNLAPHVDEVWAYCDGCEVEQ